MNTSEKIDCKNINIQDDSTYHDFLKESILNHKSNTLLTSFEKISLNDLQELHYQQLLYNNNRTQLLHCAEKTQELLNILIKFNNKQKWIMHYPVSYNKKLYEINRKNTENNKSKKNLNSLRINNYKNTYFIVDNTNQEKNDFSLFYSELNILKLDLKLGRTTTIELTQLEKSTIVPLLNRKITENIQHIRALIERIKSKSSKILVTGDLNSGKSTFCNALLRQKILPEDQQPCTEIFCEILDSYGNFGKEEVHAIPHGTTYNQQDLNTYTILKIHDLNKIVINSKAWSHIKIYVDDKRTKNESILRNGTLDISLVDSPGLNFNSITTTEIFSKQEEIDIIIFIVNAENHFTLSAKEFIWNARNEKALIFIVVNKFDNIENKQRCKDIILNQLISLSPQTYHNASELVHFVSSISVSENTTFNDNFEKLEKKLRTFILEKRTESKLSPGKTYLENLLIDIKILCETNKHEANFQLKNFEKELEQIVPICKQILNEERKVLSEVEKIIENVCSLTSKYAYKQLSTAVIKIENIKPCNYQGFLKAYSYAIKTKKKMLNYIESYINDTENFAKINTNKGINKINNLGIVHIKSFKKKVFQPQYMFSKDKNTLKKSISVNISFFDFIDFEENKHISMTLTTTACTILGVKVIGYHNIITAMFNTFNIIGVKNLKKLIIPFVCLAAFSTCSYIILNIPKVIPKKIAKKIKKEIEKSDFIYQNSLRITSECQKVLKYPQKDICHLFQRNIKKHNSRKKEILKNCKISKQASNFFTKLGWQAEQDCKKLNTIDIKQSYIR
ncbi:hypothetical protein PORY_001786 [Pneumocystis oryctolagi]|uniref:Uncharacterized protein n=1 Tax=Pneumocystis oryctolagi TaxID=42067 RepID=A0ACB7CCS2_9ASCO|nr:hypothetical protein PORY_001786 [Pneumocystis oryctolagi]